jgi:signal transduction histidine kinase
MRPFTWLKQKSDKKELKGPSLNIKWAFTSSFFIFIVFTVFAVITYKSSVNLIVTKEKNSLEQTVTEVVARLGNANGELTTISTYRNLTEDQSNEPSFSNHSSSLEGETMKIDSFISDLGQKQLDVHVYNTKQETIFQTVNKKEKLVKTKQMDPTIVTRNNKSGFLVVAPVYSKRTQEKVGYVQSFYELSSFYAIRSNLLLTLIVLEAVSLIISSIFGFFLSSYFLKPLKVLRDTMNAIRKDPQTDIHMPQIDTNDELSDLAEIFNEMLDRMRLYIQQQEQFVEDVSHELRTPVAIIEGHLSLLNRWGKDDPEILDESLSASMQEISRMKSLVQEMLDLSRAEQVDLHYGNEVSPAKEITYQVFNNFKILYPDFTITLDDDLPKEVTLGIYRNHFEQVIIILLDNAVKYSTKRHEVHISISSTLNEFEIAIQDFGEGIPPDDLNKIFNRFYRVDKARARTKGGNGLGLSIAKQLIESYKGRITVESVVSKGTIFRIYIPIVRQKKVD